MQCVGGSTHEGALVVPPEEHSCQCWQWTLWAKGHRSRTASPGSATGMDSHSTCCVCEHTYLPIEVLKEFLAIGMADSGDVLCLCVQGGGGQESLTGPHSLTSDSSSLCVCRQHDQPTHSGPSDIQRMREFDILEQKQKCLQRVVLARPTGILAPVRTRTRTHTHTHTPRQKGTRYTSVYTAELAERARKYSPAH